MTAEKKSVNAYLTVCLALCLTLVISLCLALIEGARCNGAELQAECVAEIAMESIMAEYHRELLEQYDLFALDSSYGTSVCGREKVEEHLKYYLDKNLSLDGLFLADYLYKDFFGLNTKRAEVTKVSILSDGEGRLFSSMAAERMKDVAGLALLEDVQRWMQVISLNGLENGEAQRRKQELDREIASYDGTEVEIAENVKEIVSVVNPTETVEENRRMGILKQIAEEYELSQKRLVLDSLWQDRLGRGEIHCGNLLPPEKMEGLNVAERFFFQEYLLEHMGHYGANKENAALDYQVEYLICGDLTDRENLRTIANRICVIREAANAMYLMGNEVKSAEAELLAQVVSALILLPELSPLLEAVIILGWAYAESVYDVKTIMNGGRIPLMKSDETWHYGLAAALSGQWKEQGMEGEGMSYEDYLRVFMMFRNEEELTLRAMNMVEADIRKTPGNTYFRLDACYVEVHSEIELQSMYGYCYELKCDKRYN